jgi:hypothetical protein
MRRSARPFLAGIFALAACVSFPGLLGCRSAYVQATVVNAGNAELHNIEVDYPSASFGIPSLAPGAEFHYRFKIQDAGTVKVEFADSAEASHKVKGPYVAEGQQGTMKITLENSGTVKWAARLRPDAPAPTGSHENSELE